MADCFAILGIPDTASLDQVKAAYRKLAEIHHPDKGGAAEAFASISSAYRLALKICEQPIACPACEGAGVTERSSGWKVAQIICASCGGTGTVARK